MSCHVNGMQEKSDVIREHVTESNGFPDGIVDRIKQLHPPHSEFSDLLKQDIETFRQALENLGIDPDFRDANGFEPTASLVYDFEAPLRLSRAMAELDTPLEKLEEILSEPESDRLQILVSQLRRGGIPRNQFVHLFQELVRHLNGNEEQEAFEAILLGTGIEEMPTSLGSFQKIEADSFLMGSPPEEEGRFNNEDHPEKDGGIVSISRSFEIMDKEVTQLEWFLEMDDNPSLFNRSTDCADHIPESNERPAMCPNNPVENVSWVNVQQFIRSKNIRLFGAEAAAHCHGRPSDPKGCLRLPTEAEWEFCRKGRDDNDLSFWQRSIRAGNKGQRLVFGKLGSQNPPRGTTST